MGIIGTGRKFRPYHLMGFASACGGVAALVAAMTGRTGLAISDAGAALTFAVIANMNSRKP